MESCITAVIQDSMLCATSSVSFKSVSRGGWEVRQRSYSDRINVKWLYPRDVIGGLIIAGLSCLAARRVSANATCLERRDPGRWRPSERSWQLPLKWVVSVASDVFYDVQLLAFVCIVSANMCPLIRIYI